MRPASHPLAELRGCKLRGEAAVGSGHPRQHKTRAQRSPPPPQRIGLSSASFPAPRFQGSGPSQPIRFPSGSINQGRGPHSCRDSRPRSKSGASNCVTHIPRHGGVRSQFLHGTSREPPSSAIPPPVDALSIKDRDQRCPRTFCSSHTSTLLVHSIPTMNLCDRHPLCNSRPEIYLWPTTVCVSSTHFAEHSISKKNPPCSYSRPPKVSPIEDLSQNVSRLCSCWSPLTPPATGIH